MSREFGNWEAGYFHTKILSAAEDAGGSKHAMTRMWAPVLRELYEVAYAISSFEACDSGISSPIFQSLESLPRLTKQLKEIAEELQPYTEVMREAVRQELSKRGLE